MFALALLVPVLVMAQPAPTPTPAKPEVAAPAVTPAAPVTAPAPKPAVVAPKPTSSLDLNGDGKVDATEIAAATNSDATPSDIIKDGAEVVGAAKGMKDSGLPKGVAIAVLLGVIFKLLLSLMKILGKNLAWFKTQDGKRVIKYSTLGLGALAGLMANLAFGMGWIDAITVLLSGPLAVAIHEYTSDSKPVPAPADPPKP